MATGRLTGKFYFALRDVKDFDDMQCILDLLHGYMQLTEKLQATPWRLRLKYFACTFLIYDYLRQNKQLGREEHRFSDQVMKHIYQTFETLRNGTGKD